MNIIGISAVYHDSSACLLKAGRVFLQPDRHGGTKRLYASWRMKLFGKRPIENGYLTDADSYWLKRVMPAEPGSIERMF